MQNRLDKIFSEIKTRIAYLFLSFVLTFLIAYQKSTQLTYVFLLPLLQQNDSVSKSKDLARYLIFTDVSEAFSSTVSICASISLLVMLPLVAYQLLCFTLPSLYIHERARYLTRAILLSFCWIYWVFLTHRVVIPELSRFFLRFQIDLECLTVAAEPKIFSFVCWAFKIFATASLLFVLFCAAYLFVTSQIFDARTLVRWRRSYLWVCLLLAALVSPPDILSQLFLAVIMLGISEIFLWWCFLNNHATRLASKSFLTHNPC